MASSRSQSRRAETKWIFSFCALPNRSLRIVHPCRHRQGSSGRITRDPGSLLSQSVLSTVYIIVLLAYNSIFSYDKQDRLLIDICTNNSSELWDPWSISIGLSIPVGLFHLHARSVFLSLSLALYSLPSTLSFNILISFDGNCLPLPRTALSSSCSLHEESIVSLYLARSFALPPFIFRNKRERISPKKGKALGEEPVSEFPFLSFAIAILSHGKEEEKSTRYEEH